jgi:Mrp family chromosome partitioning ATPase
MQHSARLSMTAILLPTVLAGAVGAGMAAIWRSLDGQSRSPIAMTNVEDRVRSRIAPSLFRPDRASRLDNGTGFDPTLVSRPAAEGTAEASPYHEEPSPHARSPRLPPELDRSRLNALVHRAKSAMESLTAEIAVAEAQARRLDDAAVTLDADYWLRVRNARLQQAKSEDELFQAAVKNQTASAKEYWTEVGAGKTDDHRDAIIARRRLSLAEQAVAERAALLAAEVDRQVAAEKAASRQQQRDSVAVRLQSLSARKAEYAKRLDEAQSELRRIGSIVPPPPQAVVTAPRSVVPLPEEVFTSDGAREEPPGSDRLPPAIHQPGPPIATTTSAFSALGAVGLWALAGGLGGAAVGGSVGLLTERRRQRLALGHPLSRRLTHADKPQPPPIALLTSLPRAVATDSTAPAQLEEALRTIRSELLSTGAQLVYLSAARQGDGTTSVTAGLALALAITGRKVLVVDANFFNPRLESQLGLPPSPGLSDLVVGTAIESDAHHRTHHANIDVIGAGQSIGVASDLLAWRDLPTYIRTLASGYDHALVDCPPFMDHPETAAFAGTGDLFLAVVTPRSSKAASEALASPPWTSRPLRVVMNDAPHLPVDRQGRIDSVPGNLA